MPATNGATMTGSRTFETITQPFTEAIPAPTMTAPIRPPKGMRGARRQTEEPGHQIPHNRTDQLSQDDRAVISWSSRKPREIGFATAVERQAPTRLRKAPRMTAVAVE